MTVHYTLNTESKLTEEQKKQLDDAEMRPDVYDFECPPLTESQLAEMREQIAAQMDLKRKATVSLRLDGESILLAKKYYPSYTTLMAKILYNALRDPEYIRKCLEI